MSTLLLAFAVGMAWGLIAVFLFFVTLVFLGTEAAAIPVYAAVALAGVTAWTVIRPGRAGPLLSVVGGLVIIGLGLRQLLGSPDEAGATLPIALLGLAIAAASARLWWQASRTADRVGA